MLGAGFGNLVIQSLVLASTEGSGNRLAMTLRYAQLSHEYQLAWWSF